MNSIAMANKLLDRVCERITHLPHLALLRSLLARLLHLMSLPGSSPDHLDLNHDNGHQEGPT